MNIETQALIDQIDAPVFILERDKNNRPVYVAVNTVIRDKANLSQEQVVGKTAAEIYPDKFGELAYKYHCECLSTGHPSCYELTVQLKGKKHLIRTTLSPELDEDGQVKRIVGTANYANTEQLVREAQAHALMLNTEVEHIIGLTAHDLRSPMRNMHNLTDMLREDFVDLGDGKLEIVSLLQKVSANTDSLIGNILDFAHTSGAVEVVEEFRLIPLAREIFSTLDPENNHRAEIEDVKISGDRIATQIALRNLVDNTLKHNKNMQLTIGVDAGSAEDGFFEITVSDNGCGVEDPSTLFNHEAPRVIDNSFGLYAVSRLLRSRGGDISASASPGSSGLRVTFTLPGEIVTAAS